MDALPQAWPERFIYVCSATQAAIVNALPLIHAGLDRIPTDPLFPDPNANAFRHGTIDPWNVRSAPRACSAAAAALLHLDGVGGLRKAARRDGKSVLAAGARDGALLVRSQWLEAELFNRLKGALAELPGVTVSQLPRTCRCGCWLALSTRPRRLTRSMLPS